MFMLTYVQGGKTYFVDIDDGWAAFRLFCEVAAAGRFMAVNLVGCKDTVWTDRGEVHRIDVVETMNIMRRL